MNTILLLAQLALPRTPAAATEPVFDASNALSGAAAAAAEMPSPDAQGGRGESADPGTEQVRIKVAFMPHPTKSAVEAVIVASTPRRAAGAKVSRLEDPTLLTPDSREYKLDSRDGIDRFLCRLLGGHPHPHRVLESTLFGRDTVNVNSRGTVVPTGRAKVHIKLLTCNEQPY